MRSLVLALAATAAISAAPRLVQEPMAVIVHPSTSTRDVSIDALRRYFLGASLRLDTAHVQVVETASLRKPFYRALLGISEDEVRRRWVALVFRGEATALPKTLADEGAVREYVASHPGAIGFVSADAVDRSVRALTVDGHKPTEAGYALR